MYRMVQPGGWGARRPGEKGTRSRTAYTKAIGSEGRLVAVRAGEEALHQTRAREPPASFLFAFVEADPRPDPIYPSSA